MKLNNEDLVKEFSIDKIGTVFHYQNKVLRAIKKKFEQNINDLLNCGLIDELVNKKLFPKTWKTAYIIDGFSLVLEHENLKNWNYAYEWSFNMLKDAALTTIKINKISNKYGYELFDCHCSNVIFQNNNPIYTDLGSFQKTNNIKVWSAKRIFLPSYYIPLKLYSIGYIKLANNIFLGIEYFSEEEFLMMKNSFLKLLGRNFISRMHKIEKGLDILFTRDEETIAKKIKNKGSIYTTLALFLKKHFEFLAFNNNKARILIEKLKPYKSNSLWGNYHDDVNPNESKRFNRILEIINSFHDVETVLEFAANQGKLSSYLIKKGEIKNIIATDYDENAVNKMYLENKNTKNFLSLLINFANPKGRSFDKKLQNRLSADVCIALAITHHLILSQNYDIEYIFQTISKYAKKYVLIEFMPEGLYSINQLTTPEVPKYYNTKWFKEKFLKYYDHVLDEKLAFNRHLFVGKIKERTL